MTEAPSAVFLADYQPYTHLVETVDLTFRLDPKATRVRAKITFRPHPDRPGRHPLRLDGEGLRLLWCLVDGQEAKPKLDNRGMTLAAKSLPDGPFTLETEVEIAPEGNTALEGLYMSKGMYCTQCEAEGFRKITYYPDRPDVMARFKVRIEGSPATPVLLSNGTPTGKG
jgi:aminopeptidase N